MIPVDTLEIGIDRLAEAVWGGATITDVREPGEYVAGRSGGPGWPVVFCTAAGA